MLTVDILPGVLDLLTKKPPLLLLIAFANTCRKMSEVADPALLELIDTQGQFQR